MYSFRKILRINDWLELIKEDPNLNGAYISIAHYIYLIEKENKKYKEEKRLILKDIKEWIACAKNEEFEGDKTHLEYWEMFETILRKIFTRYNTENISDDDLKYNHYLEKENENLILENKKYKKVINKTLNLLGNYTHYSVPDEKQNSYNEDLVNKAYDILKEVEHEKSNN